MQRTPTCENCLRNYELKDCRPIGNRIPLLLPCGHTFCEGCIIKSTKNNTELSCFSCETRVKFDEKGEAGVKTLVPNIYLLGLLLYNRRVASEKVTGGAVSTFNGIGNVIYKSNTSLSTTNGHNSGENPVNEAQSENTCDECNQNAATCQCNSCGDSKFCDSCFKQVHKTSKLLMKHAPLSIERINTNQLSCSLHGRKLEFYDKDTSEAVCPHCIISERCRGHDVILLSEVNNAKELKEINDVVDEAKDTLFWWQQSSKVLTKALPEEYMEANQLFDDIQSKFNAFHTILLKRHLELMREASEKIVSNSSIHKKLRELSENIGSLTSVLNDVEITMKDKNLLHLKADQLLKNLNEYIDIPSIVSRTSISEQDGCKLHLEEEPIASMECLGTIENRLTEMFTCQKPNEVSDELKEQIRIGSIASNNIDEDIKMTDILEKDLNEKLMKFPLLRNQHELVCVTDVTNPTDFKVQRMSDKDRLQVLMTDLNKYCRHANSSENLVHTVEEGQMICAQFLSDNNWYRACVTNKRSPAQPDILPTWGNGVPVEVLYIDYGNTEWLPFTRLRQLPRQFLEVPAMAVTCSLIDLKPPCQGEEWPDRSKKAFTTLTGDRPLLMNIYKRVGNKLLVDLRKSDNDEPTRDDDRPVSVREALVFLEVASYKSPSSNPSSNIHQPVRKYKSHDPIKEGELVDILVTHIEDPEAIYIQNLCSQVHDEQSRLGQVYNNSKNKKGWMIDYPHRNLVCSAKFSLDKTWYRAKVLNVNHDDTTVEVEYVDYGNRENVRFSDLRRIPGMYLEMPQQCMMVKLHDIKLAVGEECYSQGTKEFLHTFFLGRSLVSVIKAFDNDVPVVELYDTSTEVDINMNDMLHTFIMKNENSEQTEGTNDETTVKFASYLPAVIPNSARFAATGVHIDDNAVIYLNVMDNDNSCLTNIMAKLNCDVEKLIEHPKSTSELHLKQAVIAKYSQDKLWYRVEVVQIIDGKKVEVRYVDFGNTEEADICDICPEPMFLEMAGQCICVQLSGVEPNNDVWPIEVISLLREHIVSEVVGVELKGKTGKGVVLSAVIYVDDGLCINDILLKENLVKEVTTVVIADECDATVEDNDECNDIPKKPVHQSDYLWFCEQKLPKPGLKFDVMVTQVNQPNVVYIQRLPLNNDGTICGDFENDETLEEAYNNLMVLESISEAINSEGYFNGSVLDLKPVVGMACVSKYTSDELYYRARIEHLDDAMAEVVYIDYGTTETVPVDSLLPIRTSLIILPMQSTKVCLDGIKPMDNNDTEVIDMLRDTDWSMKSMELFYSVVANKRLVAEVIDEGSEIPTIRLYEQTEENGEKILVKISETVGLMKGSGTHFIIS